MKSNPVTRRQFLVGAGGAALAVPFMTSLLPSEAKAVTTARPKRFFCLSQDDGRYAPHWYPSAAEQAKLMTSPAGAQNMREMRMSAIAGSISPIFSNPSYFDGSIRDKLLMIRGLDGLWSPTSHCMSSILAGNMGGSDVVQGIPFESKQGPSIDYVLARNSKSNPNATDSRSYLRFGNSGGPALSYGYNPATQKMTGLDQMVVPSQAFASIFGANVSPAVSARKIKLVDAVLENYRSIVGNSKLSTNERQRLQEHMDSINQLENSLSGAGSPFGSCSSSPSVTAGVAKSAYGAPDEAASMDRVNKQNMDILIAAVKCGLCNVGTVQLCHIICDVMFYNLGVTDMTYHIHSHTNLGSPGYLAVTQWFANQFGYFIKALDVQEGTSDFTYLDNSLVYYGNSMSYGLTHSYLDMPVMMAGSLGGRIQTGRFIDYSEGTTPKTSIMPTAGRHYSALLVSILQAMGLSSADYQQANVSAGFGTDTLLAPNLESWRLNRKDPLPGLLVT